MHGHIGGRRVLSPLRHPCSPKLYRVSTHSFFNCISPTQRRFKVQWNPVNTDTKGTRESVRIKRVNFRENV